MSQILIDSLVVLVFILVGGVFAAAEVALISLREGQLRQLVRYGGRNGERLAKLVENPATFLATVQIGVTFATMLSSAFGAATISEPFAQRLVSFGMDESVAGPVALILITMALSFLSLVLGELAPKRLALQAAERISLLAAGPLTFLARVFRPFVWLLSRTSDLVVRLFRGDPNARSEAITSDELHSIVETHEGLTGFERQVLRDVFAAGDTKVSEVMVPRTQLDLLPASVSVSRGAKLALVHPHSRFPVMGRDADDIVGVVHIRDLLAPTHPLGRGARVGDLAKPVVTMPGTKSVLSAIQEMRRTGDTMAVVIDEYGGTDGMVTLEDLIEEIVGEMTGPGEPDEPSSGAGPILIDAGLNLDDVRELTGLDVPSGPYQTLAGFVIDRLGRIPEIGDAVAHHEHELVVTQLDRRRLVQVSLRPVPAVTPTAGAAVEARAVIDQA